MPPQTVPPVPAAASQAVEDDQFAINFWRRRFDQRQPASIPVIATLDIEYNELVLSWKRFQEQLPSEDRVSFQERPQTSQDVSGVVRGVQALWVSSPRQRVFSRSMTLCDDFLVTIDSHAIVLMTLPDHQFYSSLFYGVLQSIIKASASYPRIMEGVIMALSKVNQSISPPADSKPPSLTQDSIHSVATFYYLTFFFLGELMDWYVRRLKCRLLKSLNQDIYLDFCSLVCNIQSSAKGFMHGIPNAMDLNDSDCERTRAIMQHNELYLWEKARLSQIGQRHIDRRLAAQNALTRLLLWEMQHDTEARLGMIKKRDALLLQMLDAASRRLRPVSQQNSGIACLTTTTVQDPDIPMTQPFEGPKHRYTRVELQLASVHLQDYFDSDDQIADFESDIKVIAEESVMASLTQWAKNPDSRVLAVGGPPTTAFPSPVALISACYASLLREAKLPVVAHFCSLPTSERDGMTLFEQGLVALAYSLIRQLIEYLPPVSTYTSVCVLKAERFTPLNGTLASWKEVLSLINTLLDYAPPLLVCVIDGLDKIQDPSTDKYIPSLVRTFMTHTRDPSTQTPDECSVLLKVLFTVAGRPSSLVETLTENTLILSESNRTDTGATTDSLNPDVGVVMMNA